MTTETDEATAALAAMQSSRERLAAAATCPPERHLVFAGLLGGIVASQAAPSLIAIVIEGLLIGCVGLVVAWDRKRTGMFINGYRAGRTRPLTFGLLAIALGAAVLGIWLKLDRGIWWAPLACGLFVAVAAYVASAVWQRIYVRELRETP
jgi:hypothetical protein